MPAVDAISGAALALALSCLILGCVARPPAGRPEPAPRTLEQLRARGIEAPDFGERFAGARIPTLDEVLAIPDARLMIELKRTPRGELLVRKVVDALQRKRESVRVVLASF